MKKRNHALVKRSLAVFLVLVMCVGMLQTTAMAATVKATLVCTQEEHVHTDSCYTEVPVVGTEVAVVADDETNSETEEPNAPVIDGSEDNQLDADVSENDQLDADSPENDQPSADESEDIQTGTDSSENGQPDADESEDTQPDADSSKNDPSDTDEPEDIQTSADSSENDQSNAGEPEDTQPDANVSEDIQTADESEVTKADESKSEDSSSKEDPASDDSDDDLVASSISYSAGPSMETERVLTCGKEEHTHSSSCYSSDGLLGELMSALKNEDDKEVILELNGTTLSLEKGSKGDGQIYVREGYTLIIRDGEVAGGTIDAQASSTDYRRVIVVLGGGNVSLSGSTTLTGGYGGGGGGVLVSSGSSFTMSGGTITGNTSSASGGGVLVEKGSYFLMSGGTISENTASSGGGVSVSGTGTTFTMSDGTISGNKTDDTTNYAKPGVPAGQGGGVYVTDGASFNLKGGEISQNNAGEGGGIFIDQNVTGTVKDEDGKDTEKTVETTFNMTGGKVDSNIAHLGEGGGIYIQGTGEISKGEITNNQTLTTSDLGGGGIYVENNGLLRLKNAIITENKAAGLGGGVAACVHGKTVVYVKNGALIYGNENEGTATSQGYLQSDGSYNGFKIDGQDLWNSDTLTDGQKKFIESAKDFFTAGDSQLVDWTTEHYGAGGVIVGADALGGGSANWTGYLFAYDENGELQYDENNQPVWIPVEQDANGLYVTSSRLLAMTSAPSLETIEAAKAAVAAAGGVLISGNYSATHGGGIGNNGMLIMGEGPFEDLQGNQDLDLNKTLTDTRTDEEIPDGEDRRELVEGEFTFTVTQLDSDNPKKLTGTNHADGSVNFTFPEGTFTEEGTYTFLVEEVNDGQDGVTYDTTQYKVVIKVSLEEDVWGKLGSEEVLVNILTVGTPEVYKLAEDGSWVLVEDGRIAFNNTYYKAPEKPEDPKEPEDPEDPKEPEDPEEPEEPTTPPSNPPRTPSTPSTPSNPPAEVPEEPTPLAEVPAEETVSIPDEETPLEEITDLEIPDEEVPLADIPHTGDISAMWYAMTLLAACGLAALRILGKREKNA